MPKLGKVKIMLTGVLRENTTYPGQIELYLHYDSSKDFFYFEPEELKKYVPNCDLKNYNFENCRSKQEAIDIVQIFLGAHKETKRFLRIGLELIGHSGKSREEISEQLRVMTTYSGSRFENTPKVQEETKFNSIERTIGIRLERVMQIKLNNSITYVSCNRNWEYENKDIGYGSNHNLIEYDPSIEQFLDKTQEQMDGLVSRITEFFNVKSFEDLKSRVELANKNNLLM
jgi:hypothetical protein